MFNKIKKISLRDIKGFFLFLIVLIPSIIYKLYLKKSKKELWLICETERMARDNGYVFYKYMKQKHPEILCYYAISFKCSDYKKVCGFKDVVDWASMKHYFYYMSASKNISSHKEGNPNQTLFTILHLYLNLYNNRAFLQHGVIKDDIPMFYYKNTKFKYFICGAKDEYDYICKKNGYPQGSVIYTGLARFDNLHDLQINKKQILVIPTWRRWFETEIDEKKFEKSEYYKTWNSFINNSKLIDFIEQNNINIIFYPHFQMQKYINLFNVKSNNIIIAKNNEYDVQDLIKNSALMVTDYSSVFMDFAYTKKPIIYYQFDYEKFRKLHLSKGYFDYKDDGFGDVLDNADSVIEKIKYYVKNDYKLEEIYLERMNKFFLLNDKNNCDRIFEKISGGKYE